MLGIEDYGSSSDSEGEGTSQPTQPKKSSLSLPPPSSSKAPVKTKKIAIGMPSLKSSAPDEYELQSEMPPAQKPKPGAGLAKGKANISLEDETLTKITLAPAVGFFGSSSARSSASSSKISFPTSAPFISISSVPVTPTFQVPEPTANDPYPGYYQLPSGEWRQLDVEYYEKFRRRWEKEYMSEKSKVGYKGSPKGYNRGEVEDVDTTKEMERAKHSLYVPSPQDRPERRHISYKIQPTTSYPAVLLPQKVEVKRNEPRINIAISSFMWVLPAQDGTVIGGTLIRQEYYGAILSIIQWMQKGQQEYTDDGDNIKIEEEELSLWDVHSPYAIPFISGKQLNSFDTFPNPFDSNNITCNSGICITGLPGIGKSLFSGLIWSLRCSRNLPTLYMRDLTNAVLWKERVVYEIQVDRARVEEMEDILPPTTWCLVDSDMEPFNVPECISLTDRFIMQTASPGPGNMEWMRKPAFAAMREYFVMKPWGLDELIAGHQLQKWPPGLPKPTEEMLQIFHEKYGGSAEDAYTFANQPNFFDQRISAAAAKMDRHQLKNLWISYPSDLVVPKNGGHALLSVFPVSDSDRRKFCITFPSEEMQLRVLKLLDENEELARLKLYRIFLRAKNVGCKYLASHFLDVHFHTYLTKGGVWKLCKMAALGSRTWRATGNVTHSLVVNSTMSLVAFSEAPSVTVNDPAPVNIECFDKDTHSGPLLCSTYYLPNNRTFPTFDAFYVDRDGHAITFQTTTSRKHDVKDAGLTWLKDRGVTQATYILLTPPSEILHELKELDDASFFDSIFHMEFVL
ncbi:hypothetical protein BT96DRAFT_997945 [Gymnopus androsaceus JB14]|uniref:Uncharacterized protein n=1 Tax=Gymnopus androsaceus JB14 TaxID=1447944 RepID=A0A6A4HBC7_9AGAR|nr:hypothetical protein BT96DRAFT_997945 [Gymnopus androsaceus JB14]